MLLFALAYIGGVLTIASPCILPVLPFVFARADQPFLRRGFLPAGIAGNGARHAVGMLEDALDTPETPARDHRDFGRLAAGLLVDNRRRHDARLFRCRSRRDEADRGREPEDDKRRERGASFEG